MISSDGTNDANLKERKSKAWSSATQILAILKEVPFGKYEIEAGLLMRNSMFLNAILTNSEVRYGIKKEYIEALEHIDEYLLRNILKTNSTVPRESLYLETGSIQIRYVILD